MFLSATLTPFNKATILRLFDSRENDIAWIKEDLSRPNLFISVRPILDKEQPFADVLAALPISDGVVKPTVIYVDKVRDTIAIKAYLMSALPPALRQSVAVYHARCSEKTKERCWDAIKSGRIKIVIATECLGMV